MKFLNFALAADVSAGSFFENIWNRYFARTLEDYENFSFGEGAIPLSAIIGGIVLGIIAAFLATTFYKKTTCAFVMNVLGAGAVGKENAVELSALGLSEKILKKIENSSVLRKTVLVVRADGEEPRLYIPEDKKDFAELHFETKSASWGRFAIIAAACVVGYFLLMELVPALIGVIDGFIGSF